MIYLSVIIPQYKETDDRVRPLLTSIDMQRGINFDEIEVIIVNDASGVYLSEGMLNSFMHIKPQYVGLEHNAGPGLCRQAGIDMARGEYVTFCDADDVYHSVGVFSFYMDIIKKQKLQILTSSWLEEIQAPDGGFIYYTHKLENTWMHGKLYSKQFLMLYNIRFSDELLYHEDSYFNSIAMAMTEEGKAVFQDVITYMWTWDDGTITRRNHGAYSYESMEEFLHAIRLSCRWIKVRKPECVPEKVAQCILYGFYCITANLNEWPQEYIDKAAHELWGFYSEFKDEFDSVPFETLSQLQLQERQKVTKPFIEKITFYDYMEQLRAQYTGQAEEPETVVEPVTVVPDGTADDSESEKTE